MTRPAPTNCSYHRCSSLLIFLSSLLCVYFSFEFVASQQEQHFYPTSQILVWGNNVDHKCGYPYMMSSELPVRSKRLEQAAFTNSYSSYYHPALGLSNVNSSLVQVADGFSFKMILVHYVNGENGNFVNETIYGCGDNGNNQLGFFDQPPIAISPMAPIYTFSTADLLSTNPLRDLKIVQLTCWFDCLALTNDGKVFRHEIYTRKWVQLAFPSTMIHPDTSLEIPVNIIQIEETGAFGKETYFALTSEGFVFTWGYNNSGIRGHSFEVELAETPMIIPSLRNITFITTGSFINEDHSSSMALAINSTGHVFTWGSNEEGALGLNMVETCVTCIVPFPQLVPFNYELTGRIVKADAIALHVVAWSENGQIFTWGSDVDAQTSNGLGMQISPWNMTEYFYEKVIENSPMDSFIVKECSVSVGATACLIGGNIYSFGSIPTRGTLFPQPLSRNPPTPFKPFINSSEPEDKQQLSNIIIQGGFDCNYALITKPNKTQSTLHVWGQCQNSLNLAATAPVKEPSDDQIPFFNLSDRMIDISYKQTHALALTSNGTVIGWGENYNNQLGFSSQTQTPIPLLQEIPLEERRATQISAGVSFSLILLNNGSLIGAGSNYRGNLASEISPVSQFTIINTTFLQEGESIIDIEACDEVSFIVTSSGKVYGSGSNDGLRLVNNPSIVQIPYFVPLKGGIIDSKRIIKVVGYYFAVLLSEDGDAIVFKDGTSKKLELPDPTDSVIDISVHRGNEHMYDGVQNVHLLTRKGNIYGNGSNAWFEMSATLEIREAITPTLTISSKNTDGIPYAIGTGLNHAIVAVAKAWSCFSKNSTDDAVCNSSGFCVAPDTCRCKHVNISGIDCGEFKCFGIWRNDSNVCSGAGNCTTLDTCVCQEGFFGANCSVRVATCFGKFPHDACNGNGVCVAPDKCECKEGYYGPQCENKSCYKFASFEKELAASRRSSSMKMNLCNKILRL
ncbi:hypothetical protein C9374_005018 [Naegleria lovaniensis]|uniref:EGF-like domain-containing protein n=1 Tax=Naegleria lovaniensis TaxID=51637 RepID=A0AA88GPT0_NAELO|nr:uncharacterized protein C9374_005018 [Naegleria lovaniensis]KAG2383051.1 hypothetical protein C9374_005018 [Naegleria lovaniensis]